MITRLHPLHAIAMGVHVRKVDGNSALILCLSSNPSLLLEFSIQNEAMDIVQSAPQGAHYHVDVTYLLSSLGLRKGVLSL